MPRNGSGTYTLPQSPFVTNTVISSAAVNSDFSDIATALTGSLPRDGQAGMSGQLKLADGSTATPAMSFTNEPNTGLNRAGVGQLSVDIQGVSIGLFTSAGWTGPISKGTVPVGTIVDYGGPNIPATWLNCDGSAVSRTIYAALFTAFASTWGNGDGVTTFNLPDLRGRATFGIDPGTGRLTSTYFFGNPTTFAYGGGQDTALGVANLASHYHVAGIFDPSHAHGVTGGVIGGTSGNFSEAAPQPGFPLIIYGSAISISAAVTGVRVNSSNGLDTTYSNGSGIPFSVVPPSATVFKIVYAGV